MDMNHLLSRQQTELTRAEAASCSPSHLAHLGLADVFGREINRRRSASGALAAPARSEGWGAEL